MIISLDTQSSLGFNQSRTMVTKEEISRVMSVFGKKGGKAKTKAKAIAVRKNGKLGGRPRKKEVA